MINELIKKAKEKGIDIEVFTNHEYIVDLAYINGRMDNYNTQDITKYNIKSIINGKTIKISTDVIDIDNIIKTIKDDYEMLDNNDKDLFAEDIRISSDITGPDKINIKKVKENIKEFDKIRREYKQIKSLELQFQYLYEEKEITNSLTSLKDSNGYYLFAADISLEDNEKVKTRNAILYSKEYDIKKFKEKLIKSVILGIESFQEESIKTGKYNIILENRSTNKLLNKFYNMFYADSINKKTSPLTDKFNKKIFSDKINIVEDPTNKDFIGKSLFDNDGCKTYYKEIVKKGKFITKLYDKKTALRENVTPSGNGSGMKNAYLVPGNKSYDELINELKNGIVIENIEGLHAGINELTGDISLQATGFLIKDSKIEKALNMIILSTNIFELFSNVIEVGNDLEFFGETSGACSLLLKDITIVGKE
ncbi:MAG: metallopeptidase TldD-related protein [Bacilli bacterium]